MKTNKRELRDWFIITVIILIGFLFLILAGAQAMRFSPSWQLSADMGSKLNPDSDFLTHRPQGYVEPVDSFILTPPVWINLFQTPGATIPERVRPTAITNEPVSTRVDEPAATPVPTQTLDPTSTTAYIPPPSTRVSQPTASATPVIIIVLPPTADLAITKDDGVPGYTPGGTLTYTVIISNNGPDPVTGAVIDDAMPLLFSEWTWDCTAQNAGAAGCDPAASSTADFSDTVDLPNGASIEYTVTAKVAASASGELKNSASISLPALSPITDPDPTNNTAEDIDHPTLPGIITIGNIGPVKDTVTDVVLPGASLIFTIDPPFEVGKHAGYDLIYYEMRNGSGIAMDFVFLEIYDGTNWYPIFYWGNGVADTNSNLNIAVIGANENDNRVFVSPPASNILVNTTGVTIELDGVVPNGMYSAIRLTSPLGDDGDGCEVDAIVIVQ